jgi:phage terminase large subunit
VQKVAIRLPHIYTPNERPHQIDFWDAFHGEGRHKGKNYRIFVKVWHRRGGKDMTDWNAAIERAAEEPMTVKYAFPTSEMALDNLWESVTNDGLAFTDFVPMALRKRRHVRDDGLNDSLKSIRFINGSNLRVISAHRPERLRGGNSKLFGLSEFQAMDPRVVDIIMPIIRLNGGALLANMTANGDSAAKTMLDFWKTQPDVYVSEVSIEDSGLLSPREMESIFAETIASYRARGLSEEEAIAFVRQEYYCDWSAPVIGSYFGAGMKYAEQEGRIARVPHETNLPVFTFWDLGIDDSMTIWFVQFVGREIRLIDYYENSGEGFAHYAQALNGQLEGFTRAKKYSYGFNGRSTHYAPHDITVRNMNKEVSTRLEEAKKAGIDFQIVKRVAHKEDGIEASRSILSRCYFDKVNCARGISALKGYHKEFNKELRVYYNEPVHDWTSHGSDGFQTLSTSKLIKNADVSSSAGRVTKSSSGALHKQPATLVLANGQVVLNTDPRKAALYAARKASRSIR